MLAGADTFARLTTSTKVATSACAAPATETAPWAGILAPSAGAAPSASITPAIAQEAIARQASRAAVKNVPMDGSCDSYRASPGFPVARGFWAVHCAAARDACRAMAS